MGQGCILSKFYIKPQLWQGYPGVTLVVSYRNSTSNHNGALSLQNSWYVVSYRNSTSNHNKDNELLSSGLLYLIEILHQTTTVSAVPSRNFRLYLIEILHQTTTDREG